MKPSLFRTLNLLILSGIVLTAPADLVTITTADGNGADAHVRRGDSDANYGGEMDIEVRDASSTSDRKGYLRFDLSPVTGPVTAVSLNMIWSILPATNSYTIGVYGLTNGYAGGSGVLGETWLEGTGTEDTAGPGELNWDNAPANNTGSSSGFNANAIFLGSFTIDFFTAGLSAGSTNTFTSAALVSFLNNDTDNNLTIMLSNNQGNSGSTLAWASKEHTSLSEPWLDVEFTSAVPEPGSLLLILAGGGLCSWMRRRSTLAIRSSSNESI